jgi:hypothetical protein
MPEPRSYNGRMSSHAARFTRRQFAVLSMALPAAAQVTSKVPPQGAPAPASAAATPAQKLEKAFADVRKTSAGLAKIELPMDLEPAFSFRASRG